MMNRVAAGSIEHFPIQWDVDDDDDDDEQLHIDTMSMPTTPPAMPIPKAMPVQLPMCSPELANDVDTHADPRSYAALVETHRRPTWTL